MTGEILGLVWFAGAVAALGKAGQWLAAAFRHRVRHGPYEGFWPAVAVSSILAAVPWVALLFLATVPR